MNKIRKRFNVIDFVVIVIVIGCIAGLIVRYNIIDRVTSAVKNDKVSVNFIAYKLDPDVADSVKNGQVYYTSSGNISLGEIKNISLRDSKLVYTDKDGKAQLGRDNAKRELKGSFSVEGAVTENGFMLDGVEYLAPGKELIIYSEEVQLSVIITEIK
ncbi:MAG: DUF4330 family protein [Ruminococcaceae bacterium]|nr:DUF4330 family protein [Oscillospiraceae bacterium]